VNRFIPRWNPNGNSQVRKRHRLDIERDLIARDPRMKSAAADGGGDLFSISALLLQDELAELEKLCKEIDQFSQTFANADRERCNR
jgi:hypothetical protein